MINIQTDMCNEFVSNKISFSFDDVTSQGWYVIDLILIVYKCDKLVIHSHVDKLICEKSIMLSISIMLIWESWNCYFINLEDFSG